MFREMPAAQYHAHPAISKSGLDQIAKSPAHFRLWLTQPTEPTKEMIIGTAFHTYLLEYNTFESRFVVCDASSRNTNKYKDLVAANPGKTVLLSEERDLLEGMRKSFQSNQTVNKIIDRSLVERSIFWNDRETGVECRARPDIIFDDMLIDLKTTSDAKDYSRAAFQYRLHVQAAFYSEAYLNVTGRVPKEFLFITVEKAPPYGIIVYQAAPDFLVAGYKAMRKDLDTYAACLSADVWPGYPEEVQELKLPAWA